MKNIKNLLVATIALVSVGGMANLMQPFVPTTEDAPVRVTTGLQGGLIRDNEKNFGVNNLGLGIGFTHNVGYDFEYGLAIGGSWAAGQSGRLFTQPTTDAKISGMRLDVELLARFMPLVADSLNFGGFLSVGYQNQFGGEGLKPVKDAITFGDMSARVGLAVSYAFTDMFSLYFAPAYALTNIRFVKDDAAEPMKTVLKEGSNLSGVEFPVGFWFGRENVGVYLEANTRFVSFKKFTESWREDVTLGVSFAM